MNCLSKLKTPSFCNIPAFAPDVTAPYFTLHSFMISVTVENLTKKFGSAVALDSVNLRIEAGIVSREVLAPPSDIHLYSSDRVAESLINIYNEIA